MGFGTLGKVPTGLFHRRIDARSSSYTVTRVIGTTTNDVGEPVPDTTEFDVNVWCYTPRGRTAEWMSGDHTTGVLQAMSNADVDLQYDDRLTHDGVEYEVDEIITYPDETHPVYHEYRLVRRDGP